MKLQTFFYQGKKGWSVQSFPELDSPSTLVLLFFAPGFIEQPEVISALAQAYPTSCFLGCSTAGEIFGSRVSDGTLTVAVAKFERTSLALTQSEVANPSDSLNAGKSIGAELNRPDLAGVLILSDGLAVNGNELVSGVSAMLERTVPVMGGLAGDGLGFTRSWVLDKTRTPKSGLATAIGFYGSQLKIFREFALGWHDLGLERLVTRSKGNVIYELDRTPALSIYKNYIQSDLSKMPLSGLHLPIALRQEVQGTSQVIRQVIQVDEEAQSLTLSGEIPQGARAQVLKGSAEGLIPAISEITARMKSQIDGASSVLAVSISAAARRRVLAYRADEEAELLLESLGDAVNQVGFYGYGEISSSVEQGVVLKNGTMALTLLTEMV